MEEWRDIEGYEGYYKVSNLGRVARVGGKVLSPRTLSNGTEHVSLSVGGLPKTKMVSRLVYAAFIGTIPDRHSVWFRDKCQTNYSLENLYLVDRREWTRKIGVDGRVALRKMDYHKSLWTDENLAVLRELYPTHTSKELSVKLGVSVRSVRNAIFNYKISKN